MRRNFGPNMAKEGPGYTRYHQELDNDDTIVNLDRNEELVKARGMGAKEKPAARDVKKKPEVATPQTIHEQLTQIKEGKFNALVGGEIDVVKLVNEMLDKGDLLFGKFKEQGLADVVRFLRDYQKTFPVFVENFKNSKGSKINIDILVKDIEELEKLTDINKFPHTKFTTRGGLRDTLYSIVKKRLDARDAALSYAPERHSAGKKEKKEKAPTLKEIGAFLDEKIEKQLYVPGNVSKELRQSFDTLYEMIQQYNKGKGEDDGRRIRNHLEFLASYQVTVPTTIKRSVKNRSPWTSWIKPTKTTTEPWSDPARFNIMQDTVTKKLFVQLEKGGPVGDVLKDEKLFK